jgi:hypothetical protein
MRHSIARLVHQVMLPVTLVAFMSVCHKWSTVEPGQPFAEEGTAEVRITQTHGQRVVVKEAAVVGDSVVGLVNGDSAAFALSEMDKIQVRKGDWVGTTLVVFGAAAGALGAFVGVACAIDCDFSIAASGGYEIPIGLPGW